MEIFADYEIRLKEIGHEDAEPIFRTIDSERDYLGEWLPFVENTINIKDTQGFIESLSKNETNDLTFCIFYRQQFAGIIGLKDPDYNNLKVEIGYWLSERFQHKGVITRACKALIKYAFTDLNMNRVQIKAATENSKSIAVAERLGFEREGVERAGELHSRGFLDLVIFSLLKNDFFKTEAQKQ